jgi:hypothetical protein
VSPFDARAAALATYIDRYKPVWRHSRKFRDVLNHDHRCEIFKIVIEILSDPAVDRDPQSVVDAVFEQRRVIWEDRDTVWFYVRRWPKYQRRGAQLELFDRGGGR